MYKWFLNQKLYYETFLELDELLDATFEAEMGKIDSSEKLDEYIKMVQPSMDMWELFDQKGVKREWFDPGSKHELRKKLEAIVNDYIEKR